MDMSVTLVVIDEFTNEIRCSLQANSVHEFCQLIHEKNIKL